MRTTLLAVALFVFSTRLPQARAQDNEVDQIAPQREISGHWWLDATATGTSSVSRGAEDAARAGAEAALVLHAEEDGGIMNSFILSSFVMDARAQIAAGGQNPGAGATVSASSRVLQFRFMDRQGTVYELVPVDMWASVDHQAIPDLSSRREIWRRPYARQVLGGSLSFGDVTARGWDFLRVSMETARFSQDDDVDVVRHREHTFEGTFVMYNKARDGYLPDLNLDIVRMGASGIIAEDGPDAVVGFVDLLRVNGIGLFRDQIFADASFGLAGTGTLNMSGSSGDDEWSTTINTEDLPNTGSWIGSARIHGLVNQELGAGLELDKSMYLTVDVELAIEQRLSAYAEWRNRHGALLVRGFASRNKLWLDKEMSETSTTGGVFASWHQPVGHGLSLISSVEVARSFYADLDDASGLRPQAATGVNAFVTLARHFGTDWRERRFTGI